MGMKAAIQHGYGVYYEAGARPWTMECAALFFRHVTVTLMQFYYLPQ